MSKENDAPAIRALKNHKVRGKRSAMQEAMLWSRDDALAMYHTWLDSAPEEVREEVRRGKIPRIRFVRVNPQKPFLPDNARVELFSVCSAHR